MGDAATVVDGLGATDAATPGRADAPKSPTSEVGGSFGFFVAAVVDLRCFVGEGEPVDAFDLRLVPAVFTVPSELAPPLVFFFVMRGDVGDSISGGS